MAEPINVIIRKMELAAFRARFDGGLPARSSEQPAVFLDGSGVTKNPVFVQDLAIWLPLLVGGAWWLWNRQPLSEVVVGVMLVLPVLEAIGVAIDK